MPANLLNMRDAQVALPEWVVLDTSVVLEVANKSAPEVLAFLRRLAQEALGGRTLILVPLLVMEECYFKLIQYHYERAGFKKWHDEGYKAHPEMLTAFWPTLNLFYQAVVNLPAVITGPEDMIVTEDARVKPLQEEILENIRRFQLLPKDAYIVAEAERLGVTTLAAADTDFDRLDGFTVYRPL